MKQVLIILFTMLACSCFGQSKKHLVMSAMTKDSLESPVYKDTLIRMYIDPKKGSRWIVANSPEGKKPWYRIWFPRPKNK